MECFGFSCRFKEPNILKHRRGDPELRKHRKNGRERRHHRNDEREVRNGIWGTVSQAVESSRIPSLARTFNGWFNQHVPGHQRRDSSTLPPWERSQLAVNPDQSDVGNNYKDKELVEDVATTGGKQDQIPASRKPRVARVKPVPKGQLPSQILAGETTEDQVSAVGDRRDSSGRRKTEKKVSKSRKNDQTEPEEAQYLEVGKLRKDFPFRRGEECSSLRTLGKPALPPIRSNSSDIVVKKRRRKVKHMSERFTKTEAIAEKHYQPADGAGLSAFESMADATEAAATTYIMSFANPNLTGDWMGDTSPEGETGEEAVSDTNGPIQPKKKAPLRVKKGVQFLIEEGQLQDSVPTFLRSQDDKPSKLLNRSQYNEAWPLQKKHESERRRRPYRTDEKNQSASNTTYARQDETGIRIKGKNKYSKHDVKKAHLTALETDDAGDFDVDEAIADILRNMGEMP